jgi:hypothetical protein
MYKAAIWPLNSRSGECLLKNFTVSRLCKMADLAPMEQIGELAINNLNLEGTDE